MAKAYQRYDWVWWLAVAQRCRESAMAAEWLGIEVVKACDLRGADIATANAIGMASKPEDRR